jgi:catechol 2,3-dioxygenase-like lactoylglutathione lyase family enzyme
MLVNQLFHIAIKSADIEATRRFYTDVMGMTLAARPKLPFPGYWLQAAVPGGFAMFHIYGGYAALEPDGSRATGTGVIDHVSITVKGFEDTKQRLREFHLPFREQKLPDAGLLQIFVYDPNQVMLELTYLTAGERVPDWEIQPDMLYRPAEKFFDPAAYRQFAG